MKTLIKGATILTIGNEEPYIGDILIDGDRIADIQSIISTGADVIIHGGGWLQCPG